MPDYNPIELGFNSLKTYLKRNRAGTSAQPVLSCFLGLRVYENSDAAAGWFRFRGYYVPLHEQEQAAVAAVVLAVACVAVIQQRKRKQHDMMR